MRAAGLGLATVAALFALAAPALAAPDPLRPHQWGLDMVEADAAHQVTAGAGALVGVVDTGVQASHPDLQGRLVLGEDFIDHDTTPQDGNGHGTHITGIIAANANNGVGGAGVAPAAKVLVVRALDNDGTGSTDDVAAGIDWAVDHGAQVINLSLGGDVPLVGAGPAYDAAIGRALDRGVIVVAAAGNSAVPACDQPSGSGRLLCVAAVDKRGIHSLFSNFGNGLGISAPGGSAVVPAQDEDIWSTWTNSGYEELAGTSQAAAFVSGVAALVVSCGLHGQAGVQRILATARDAGTPGTDPVYGAGIVDARAAVSALSCASGGTRSGAAGSPGVGTGAATARVRIASPQRIRDVLRRGIRVTCTVPRRGRCSVIARRNGRLIASARRTLAAGHTLSFGAPLNRRGRTLVAHARRLRVSVRVTLPGASPQTRSILLKR